MRAKMPRIDPFQSMDLYMARLMASPEGRGAVARGQVERLAARDAAGALRLAREIEHPWYRCQALAAVVEADPAHPHAEKLLDEAFAAARSQEEPNRIASVALWPLRLLVHRWPDKAAACTRELLETISHEPHALRRLDGLAAILTAIATSNALREAVLPPFEAAAHGSSGWRTERIIDGIAALLIPLDRDAAARLLGARPPSRYTRRSRRMLAATSGATAGA